MFYCSNIIRNIWDDVTNKKAKMKPMVCRPGRGINGDDGYWEPCAPSAYGAVERDLTWFATNNLADKVLIPSITMRDFEKTLLRARPTVAEADLEIFTKFTAEFGEEGV